MLCGSMVSSAPLTLCVPVQTTAACLACGVGILARQPSFQRGLLGLVHRRDRDIDRCRRVTFGVVGATLQLAGYPLGLPLGDLVARDRLPLLRPILHVSLRS